MTTPSKTCAKSALPTIYTQKSKLGISGTLNQCILSKIHTIVAESMTFDKNKTQRLESKTWPLPDTIFDLHQQRSFKNGSLASDARAKPEDQVHGSKTNITIFYHNVYFL